MKYLEKVKKQIEEVENKPFTPNTVIEMYYLLNIEKCLMKRHDYHMEEMKEENPKRYFGGVN